MAPKTRSQTKATPWLEPWDPKSVWRILLAVRIVNALSLVTFFQPDEYYQALEPAWALAFGKGKLPWEKGAHDGPYVTWEWEHKLRSSMYPWILAAIYQVVGILGDLFLSVPLRAEALVYAPKLVHGLSAAVMDYSTWGLAKRVWGQNSLESKATLALAVLSPWQWYVSTRTFSNSVETTLTVLALYYWPWEWLKKSNDAQKRDADSANLKYVMLLAATATLLRPTNILIWATLSLVTVPYATTAEFTQFLGNASLWGSVVLGASSALDRYYYNEVTFPPFNFYNFNLEEGLSEFYGTNRPDYYLTEGVPLLLTTALPFGIAGIIQALSGSFLTLPTDTESGEIHTSVQRALAITALVLPITLSFIAHKEARFIYPILPLLLTIASRPFIGFFHPFPKPSNAARKVLLTLFIGFNVTLAIYAGIFHNGGIISAMSYLRAEHERVNPKLARDLPLKQLNLTTATFLMPCHSTPWRSHLVHPGLRTWSLTCKPPLGLEGKDREDYVDEADKFYDDPQRWMSLEFGTQRREWPSYLVFFEQLMPKLNYTLVRDTYEEGFRSFNSIWHDDWRRQGDVIVWVKTKDYGGPGRRYKPLPRGAAKGLEDIMDRVKKLGADMDGGKLSFEEWEKAKEQGSDFPEGY